MESRVNNTMKKKHFKEKNKNGQEEMKNQLREAGIIEEGLTETEMKQLLEAVDISKHMTPNNENSSQPDYYEVSSSPRSPYHHNGSESSTFFSKKTNENLTNDDKTPSPRENFETSYPRYNISLSPDRKIELPTTHRNSIYQESRNYSFVLLNKLESWRIDPLACKKLENDVPLPRQKHPSPTPRHRFRMVNEVPVIPNEMRKKNQAIFDEIEELYCRNMQKPDIDEVQWGTPIKVGTDNGSLDKFPISSNRKFKNVPEEYNPSKAVEEFGLRSRNLPKKGSYAISDDDDNDDDDEEKIFQNKRKKNSTFNYKPNSPKNGLIKSSNIQNTAGNQKRNDESSFVHDEFKISSDEISKRRRSATPDYPEPFHHNQSVSSKKVNSYNVEVEVHNEAEKHNKSLNRSNSVEYEPIRHMRKQNESLNDEEIEAQLITDDEDEEEKVVPPSPESRLSKRLRLSQSMLQNNRMKEENEKRKAEEEKILAAKKEIHEKEERAKRRLEDNDVKAKQREMEKKKIEEKEKMYRNSFPRNHKWLSRTELESDELSKDEITLDVNNKSSEIAQTLSEVHNKPAKKEKNKIEEIQCPICNKNFPKDQVEAHAGSCEAYVNEDQNDNSQFTEFHQFKCVKCKNFSTNDRKAYKQHIEYECDTLNLGIDNRSIKSSKSTDTKTPAIMTKIHAKKRKR